MEYITKKKIFKHIEKLVNIDVTNKIAWFVFEGTLFDVVEKNFSVVAYFNEYMTDPIQQNFVNFPLYNSINKCEPSFFITNANRRSSGKTHRFDILNSGDLILGYRIKNLSEKIVDIHLCLDHEKFQNQNKHKTFHVKNIVNGDTEIFTMFHMECFSMDRLHYISKCFNVTTNDRSVIPELDIIFVMDSRFGFDDTVKTFHYFDNIYLFRDGMCCKIFPKM